MKGGSALYPRTQDLKQEVFFDTSPALVYDALTNPKKHARFTGLRAQGTDKLGEFSTLDGYSFGENILLEEDKLIVQKWSCTDFPEDFYSDLTIEIHDERGGTKLVLIQSNIPSDSYGKIVESWNESYWRPLRRMLNESENL
jgi:activator of HSP90 ATPase